MNPFDAAYIAAILLTAGYVLKRAGTRDTLGFVGVCIPAAITYAGLFLPDPVAACGIAYLLHAVASLALATTRGGDVVTGLSAVIALLAVIAHMGVLSSATGQGISLTFWHLMTVCQYGQLGAVVYTVTANGLRRAD